MDTKGKLIVIEGVDGSGKETQTGELYAHLWSDGRRPMQVSYPRYHRDSSAMVRKYLAGEFGTDPGDVSPYVASTFYAADRYASYKEDLEDFLGAGGIVLADRYTTSNMVHQAGKLSDPKERRAFLKWLTDYEFGLLGLPVPDAIFFLDIPPEVSAMLMAGRANKITGEAKKDIHEAHPEYLRQSYANARELAVDYGWRMINCIEGDKLRSIEDIHQEIYGQVKALLAEDDRV
ncbi:MAG: thymidylate kinase [Eubacterium aggregans]|uniref:Thymidylate kinase n=1 Tax=Eubacterium aggregans TaxID=81409 RepID=A0A1H4C169_9FIRM|nr:thymidylate kinase [Eubacterium aggregans]MDD4691668.1 thymidylate kinase [Eubacterium aggregans]MEA5072862.1 thymidylate kinase [Eubacterium aggregans]SEA54138.1 dTMP kinase [Eubacterium aggregans]